MDTTNYKTLYENFKKYINNIDENDSSVENNWKIINIIYREYDIICDLFLKNIDLKYEKKWIIFLLNYFNKIFLKKKILSKLYDKIEYKTIKQNTSKKFDKKNLDDLKKFLIENKSIFYIHNTKNYRAFKKKFDINIKKLNVTHVIDDLELIIQCGLKSSKKTNKFNVFSVKCDTLPDFDNKKIIESNKEVPFLFEFCICMDYKILNICNIRSNFFTKNENIKLETDIDRSIKTIDLITFCLDIGKELNIMTYNLVDHAHVLLNIGSDYIFSNISVYKFFKYPDIIYDVDNENNNNETFYSKFGFKLYKYDNTDGYDLDIIDKDFYHYTDLNFFDNNVDTLSRRDFFNKYLNDLSDFLFLIIINGDIENYIFTFIDCYKIKLKINQIIYIYLKILILKTFDDIKLSNYISDLKFDVNKVNKDYINQIFVTKSICNNNCVFKNKTIERINYYLNRLRNDCFFLKIKK